MKKCYIRVFTMVGCCILSMGIAGCGSEPKSKGNVEKKAAKTQEMVEGRVLSERSVNGYDLQLLCQSEEEVTDELSPYYQLYKGNYMLVSRKGEKVVSKMELTFFDSETELYFPKAFTINTEDYNGDDLEDFALGQYVSGTAKQYHFYTVSKEGDVKQLSVEGDSSGAITASDKDYSPVFEYKDNYIFFKEYQQKSGKYIRRKVKLRAIDKKEAHKGIYYEKINKKEVGKVYNPLASYAYAILSDENSVYTSSESWEWKKEDDRKAFSDKYLGKKLGRIYDNHHLCWSVNEKELYESTGVGALYQMKGCDRQNRVCVLYESKSLEDGENCEFYFAEVFDCLNDIYLQYGRELYQDRLCFDSFHSASEEMGGRKWTEEEIKSFKEKLYRGRFVRKEDVDIDRIQEQGKNVCFTDDMGQSIELIVLENEIVAYQRGEEWYVIKL